MPHGQFENRTCHVRDSELHGQGSEIVYGGNHRRALASLKLPSVGAGCALSVRAYACRLIVYRVSEDKQATESYNEYVETLPTL